MDVLNYKDREETIIETFPYKGEMLAVKGIRIAFNEE